MLPNSQLNKPAPQAGQGKKTAGVDGMRAISPRQRFELVESIKGNLKAKPLRRVWIPKPGRDEKSWNRNTHNPRQSK
ncbi:MULTISPECIES: HNH endonuclease, partial [unclassified Limnospira]|uniref:HNH endonuclease n=2 Tax=Oscillatoriophycideae TaxID=1301283 RepID=UPI0028E14F43|nr:HNH endonuclease [Limnospira sp. PMC 289.06]MDT9313790.1 HNH endonuclease [Limnospira sp. Paracas R14]